MVTSKNLINKFDIFEKKNSTAFNIIGSKLLIDFEQNCSYDQTNVKIQILQKSYFFFSSLGADGIDLMQGEGCGIRNLRCNDQTSIHLNLLERIRKKLPKGMTQICKFYISNVRIHFLVGLRIF